ncbi:MAG: hypothetical protein LUE61_09395 [Clostridiales bacterium]|nr:hypothetical protein [Clostridiales bacterium]
MILSQVTRALPLARSVPLPDGAALLAVHHPQGGELVAADTLGCRPGDRVVLGERAAATALFGTNCPWDAVVVAVLE